MKKKVIVVLTAFGRGFWLASELARLDHVDVHLLDVSESLGRWTPEDYEGPFGLFHSEQLSQTQIGRLSAEDYHDDQPQGFTVWLPDGPIDFKGPLTQFWLDNNRSMKNLRDFYSGPAKFLKSVFSSASEWSFSDLWLLHLSYQMASTVFSPNALSIKMKEPCLPLFSTWSTRRVSRKGYQRLTEWCDERGVRTYSKVNVEDIELVGSQIQSLEVVSSDFRGVVNPDQVVSCLTGAELRMLNPDLYSKLYSAPLVEPEWAWVRYRAQLDIEDYEDAIPGHFVVIGDPALPWVHDNLMIAQKVVTGSAFDVWMRIPYHQRFQRKVLEDYSQKVVTLFSQRILDSDPKIIEMPQEYHYHYEELGPALFSVYGEEGKSKVKLRPLRNLSTSSPESWSLMDWTGRFAHEQDLFEKLKKWVASMAPKEKRDDREVYAP